MNMQQLAQKHWLLSDVTWIGLQSSLLLMTVMEASGQNLNDSDGCCQKWQLQLVPELQQCALLAGCNCVEASTSL